ncbi:TPA: hypothetical protein IAD52_04590 [Candidatus Spyradomonas excrementavium]|nr:hypothetical protein [Candidatus Spyradomonas excrementavium]
MNLQDLTQNKPLLYGIIGGLVVVLALVITLGITLSSKGDNAAKTVKEKVIKEPLDLLTTDNLGKAIEIQALLAREGIEIKRRVDGTKSTLYLEKYTMSTRDRALLAIVKSGLMDQNVGLEVFDKGDFTSTKEDKRIRLSRAINGELSRLIRKIPPIENASVLVSIPEQTMFAADQKPITATVQVVMPSGEKLDAMKVKAIKNLLLGTVNGLIAENISITDTNGNVYDSIVSADDDLLAKIQENDQYMQQKVKAQLDKLVGKGNYVATVSTYLRESPMDKSTIDFDPNKKTAVTEQTFSEGLGDQTRDSNKGISAVSVYLPNGLPANNADSSQNRSYSRTARETQYGVAKIQTNEFLKPGVVEDISIAVTLEESSIPPNTTLEEMKVLIAKAASPKAKAENVEIAFTDSLDPFLAGDKPEALPKPDATGNPWWIAIALMLIGLAGGLKYLSGRIKAAQDKQKSEIEMLREKSAEQEKQLRDVNLKAAELIERQTQMAQGLLEQRNQGGIPELNSTIAELTSDLEDFDDDAVAEHVKSWIEKA